MTKSTINPKLLKIKIHFDDNDCFGKCNAVVYSDAKKFNLLTIMGQNLSNSLLRVESMCRPPFSCFFGDH